jgi:nucleoside-triphosphatase
VDEGTPRLLLEGRPGIGKTTVVRRLVAPLLEGGVPVGGFTTAKLRTGGRREGFLVEAVSGAPALLAHIDLPGPPQMGRFGVDLAAFDRVALPALREPGAGGVVPTAAGPGCRSVGPRPQGCAAPHESAAGPRASAQSPVL